MTIQSAHKKATGLSIEEGVKKAMEGGYKSNDQEFLKALGVDVPLYVEKIFLDPAYWKALGKAEGWKEFLVNGNRITNKGNINITTQKTWLYHWHRFINHLVE